METGKQEDGTMDYFAIGTQLHHSVVATFRAPGYFFGHRSIAPKFCIQPSRISEEKSVIINIGE